MRRDTVTLALAALLLAAGFFQPTLPWKRSLFEHVVVIDVTQSMNVQDQQIDGRPASRLAFAKQALHEALTDLPCGSKLGWAIFTEYRSYLLFTPVEVCANRAELRASLAGIDGRMAWSGNSEIAKGLHSGIVVGSDGFGYIKEAGAILKFPQLGRVIIEDNVEIGANTTIDRGSLSNTVIGSGTKIDNLCQIAHNVKIGKNVLMAAQCGISGSTTIEDNVTIGGQVGVADNITIGANTLVAAKSGIIGSIEKDAVVWGIPARPIAQTKRQMASLTWLAKNMHRLSQHLKDHPAKKPCQNRAGQL